MPDRRGLHIIQGGIKASYPAAAMSHSESNVKILLHSSNESEKRRKN